MLQYLSKNEWTGGLGGTVRFQERFQMNEHLTKALKPACRQAFYSLTSL
jgi:hypothetical protein